MLPMLAMLATTILPKVGEALGPIISGVGEALGSIISKAGEALGSIISPKSDMKESASTIKKPEQSSQGLIDFGNNNTIAVGFNMPNPTAESSRQPLLHVSTPAPSLWRL